MEENARKRKREEAGEENQGSDLDEFGTEQPKEGLRGNAKQKKQKKDQGAEQGDGDRQSQRDEKRAAKVEKKKLKEAEKKEKRKEKQKEKKSKSHAVEPSDVKATVATAEGKEQGVQKKKGNAAKDLEDDEMEDIAPLEGFSAKDSGDNDSTAPTSPIVASNAFDSSNQPSGSSSVSSIVPPTDLPGGDNAAAKKNEAAKEAKPSREELQLRVQKRLEELRAARHADGLNGKPAKNRQELMEARRQKEEQRRAHKKEMRQKAKEEEEKRADEAISKRFSSKNPGSLLSSPGSPADSITSISNNFSFGRVVFADGQQADPGLTGVRDAPKKRGPQDVQGALNAAEAKAARLSGYDEAKRADIEEKDMWLNAKKKAHGERVKDDVSLLKKALNRKEGTKKRSEKQWQERMDGVAKGKEMRQAKREENLRKRREEKGNKGKKSKARPGFEGSFKSKAGGKKK